MSEDCCGTCAYLMVPSGNPPKPGYDYGCGAPFKLPAIRAASIIEPRRRTMKIHEGVGCPAWQPDLNNPMNWNKRNSQV